MVIWIENLHVKGDFPLQSCKGNKRCTTNLDREGHYQEEGHLFVCQCLISAQQLRGIGTEVSGE